MLRKTKVYLAGPFFNDHQVEVVRNIEEVLNEFSEYLEVYSPSRDGVKLDIKTSTYEDRLKVFNDNVDNLRDASLVIGITDGGDTGTMWELGVAQSLNKFIVEFTENPDGEKGTTGSNGEVVVTTYNHLREFLNDLIKSINKDRTLDVEYITNTLEEDADNDEICIILREYSEKKLINLTEVFINPEEFKKNNDYDPRIRKEFFTDLIVANIDDRGVLVSKLLGSTYANFKILNNETPRIVTCTNHDFGVNIMLMHSIAKHCKSSKELVSYLDNMILENGKLVVDDSFAKNATDFE